MNKTVKIGLTLLAVGIVINILERLAWPSIRDIPIGDPMKLPMLTILGICLIASPLLIIGGFITAIVGAVRGSR